VYTNQQSYIFPTFLREQGRPVSASQPPVGFNISQLNTAEAEEYMDAHPSKAK
jgi:hypothetical protein